MSEEFENHIRRIARHLTYPSMSLPLSNHSQQQRHWLRLRHAVLVIIVMLGVVFAVPDVRAALLQVLRLGSVTITLEGVNNDGEPLRLDQIVGETSLEEAQSQIDFRLRLPPDSMPDNVFVQNNDIVILVWLDGDLIETALYQISGSSWQVLKSAETVIQTQVGEADAVWISGEHPVQFHQDGQVESAWTYFVSEHVLIWEEGGVTLRLETHLALDEARHFAASLMPHVDGQ